MSQNTRKFCQRQLDFAIGNVNAAGEKLEGVIQIYEPQHPEVSQPLVTIQTVLIEVLREIELVKRIF